MESNEEEEEEAAGVRMSRLPRREGSAQVDEPRRGAGRSCIRRTRRAPSDTGPLSDVDEASPERSRRGTATAAAPPTGRRALAAAIFGGVLQGKRVEVEECGRKRGFEDFWDFGWWRQEREDSEPNDLGE